jgi:hypothetical protein
VDWDRNIPSFPDSETATQSDLRGGFVCGDSLSKQGLALLMDITFPLTPALSLGRGRTFGSLLAF